MAVKLTTKIPTTRAKPKDKPIQPVSALYEDNIGAVDTSYRTNISYGGSNAPAPNKSPVQPKAPTSLTASTANAEPPTPNTETKTAQTPSSEPVDSYAQWLINNGKNIEQNHLDAITAINQQKETAVQAAETERQRGIVDARSSYAQNLASYGANAEAMQSMGLQGSGYSEYLNSQAYAQQRAEVQGANAQAQAAKAAAEQQANQQKISAALSYKQNLAANDQALTQYQQEQTENKKTNYMAAVNDINAYGSELDVDYFDNLLEMDYISQEQYNSLKEKYSKKVAEGVKGSIEGFNSYDYGSDYTQSALDLSKANKDLDDLYNAGKLSEADYNSLKAELNITTKKHSKYFTYHVGTKQVRITFGQTSRDENKEYNLKLDGKVTDPSVIAALNKLSNGSDVVPNEDTVVVYGNKMYLYDGMDWINVKGRKSNISDAIKEYLKYND